LGAVVGTPAAAFFIVIDFRKTFAVRLCGIPEKINKANGPGLLRSEPGPPTPG
jgi:hypothetical protein